MAESKLVVNLSDLSDRIAKFSESFAVYLAKGTRLMATIQELNDALDVIVQKTVPDYIAGRDAIDADLNAKITDLTAQLAAGAVTAAEVQAGISAAFAKAEAEKALLAPPGAPPVVEPPVVEPPVTP